MTIAATRIRMMRTRTKRRFIECLMVYDRQRTHAVRETESSKVNPKKYLTSRIATATKGRRENQIRVGLLWFPVVSIPVRGCLPHSSSTCWNFQSLVEILRHYIPLCFCYDTEANVIASTILLFAILSCLPVSAADMGNDDIDDTRGIVQFRMMVARQVSTSVQLLLLIPRSNAFWASIPFSVLFFLLRILSFELSLFLQFPHVSPIPYLFAILFS